MRLYSENYSPFSAPVRIAIYAKGLDVEIVSPPGGLRSAQYHVINPLGTIPCLVLEDGTRLPESSAIMEYLEEKFPSVRLLPLAPEARAQVRLLQRIGELHITTHTVELAQLPKTEGSEETGSVHLTRIVRGLAALQNFLSGDDFAVGPHLTLADCQLAPALFRVPRAVGAFMNRDLIGAYPKVAQYIGTSRRHAAVARVLDEMAAALS